MKILVTGCAGFIGSRVAEALVRRGDEVLGVDNLVEAYDPRVKQWRIDNVLSTSDISWTKLDIADSEEVSKLLSEARPDAVINLAARAGVRQSIDDPNELIGQLDRLKKLIRHPSAEVRRSVYWALGRTGKFSLVPEMLEGLKDPNVDVNVEAEMALRFISRRPNGFGTALDPLGGLTASDPEADRLRNATEWRIRSFKNWSQ